MKDYLPHYTMMAEQVHRLASAFDILHFHIDMFHFPLFRGLEHKTLTTLHGRQDLPDLWPFYRAFPEMPLVSISDAQRAPIADANFAGTCCTACRSICTGRPTTRAAAIWRSWAGSRPRSGPTAPSRSPGRWACR